MPIVATKLGPGTLMLGGTLETNLQVTACKLVPSENVTSTDPKKVLSGDELAGSDTASYSFTLDGTFLQDLGAASGVVEWSWTNMGTEQPFTFVPNTAAGTSVTGTLVPVPLQIGGDDVEGEDLTSDFSWRVKGTPTPTW